MNKNKFQIDDRVVIKKGRLMDCCGRLCRQCKYTGMFWLILDKNNDTSYARTEFGPFFASELAFNPAFITEQQQCLPLNN